MARQLFCWERFRRQGKRMDVLFVSFPISIGVPMWNLGYRSMISSLREKGHTAGIIYPRKLILERNLAPDEIKLVIKKIQDGMECSSVVGNELFLPIVREFADEIQRRKPLILGFTVYDYTFAETLSFIRHLKQAGIKSKIAVGGHYATFTHEDILRHHPEIDFVVRGEGEETICELVACLRKRSPTSSVLGLTFRDHGTIRVNTPRPVIEDLNGLPPPATDHYRELLGVHGGTNDYADTVAVGTSRGCYGSCSYCTIKAFYNQCPHKKLWRALAPRNAVDHLEDLHTRFGITRINFIDDTFIGGRPGRGRAIAIANEIMRRKLKLVFSISARADELDKELLLILKKAGLSQIFLGIESAFQRGLDTYHKQLTVDDNTRIIALLKKLDIELNAIIIFFDPYLQPTEALLNLAYLKKLRANRKNYIAPFADLEIYQGIPLIPRLASDKLLRGNYLRYCYRFVNPDIRDLHTLWTRYACGGALLDVMYLLMCKRKRNVLSLGKRLFEKTEYVRASAMGYLSCYSDWYQFFFLVSMMELYLRSLERRASRGDDGRMIAEMMRRERGRQLFLYREIFASLLGDGGTLINHHFRDGGEQYYYVGQTTTLLRIEDRPKSGRVWERFGRTINDAGFCVPTSADARQHAEHFELSRLRSWHLHADGLDGARFRKVAAFLRRRYPGAARTAVHVHVQADVDAKTISGSRRDIAAYCRREGLILQLHLVGLEASAGHALTRQRLGQGGCVKSQAAGKACDGMKWGMVWGRSGDAREMKNRHKKQYHCSAGRESLFVDQCTGDVYPCRGFWNAGTMRLGNVYDGYWSDVRQQLFRDAMVDKKPLCRRCWAKYMCGGGCQCAAFNLNESLYRPVRAACPRIRRCAEELLRKYVSGEG